MKSTARGDPLDVSDWDVIIVSGKFIGVTFTERASLILKELPIRRVELFCYTKKEFNQKAEEIGVVSEAIKNEKLI